MNRSSVPSTPKRGPGGTTSPSREAAADNAELVGAGNRTHNDIPPWLWLGRPVRKMFAQKRSQQVPPMTQYVAPLREELVGLGEEACGGQLFDDRGPHVDGRTHRCDGRQCAAFGADPADA